MSIKALKAWLTLGAVLLLRPTFAQPAPTLNYEEQIFEGVTYGIYRPETSNISLHWQDKEQKAYGSFSALYHALQAQNRQVLFITNAGIYSKSYRPAGLWIEKGQTLNALNTQSGSGNFHLQPNGVFLINDQGAHILTTKDYQRLNPSAFYALQSGPMLVINGKINPRFQPQLKSPYKRNAVCIDKEGNPAFILTLKRTQEWPNLYQFSHALKNLSCQQALYLDGSISSWYLQGKAGLFHWSTFVGLIAVTL